MNKLFTLLRALVLRSINCRCSTCSAWDSEVAQLADSDLRHVAGGMGAGGGGTATYPNPSGGGPYGDGGGQHGSLAVRG